MPGFMLHVGATVLCAHAGQAQPTVPNPRVTVTGQPTVTMSAPYAVAVCTLPPPPVANGPCVTAQWVTAAAALSDARERWVKRQPMSFLVWSAVL